MARVFYPLERFAPVPPTFHLLPFRFTRLNGKELLVNEAGEFLFAPSGTVQRLTDGQIDTSTELYRDLKAKHFVYDDLQPKCGRSMTTSAAEPSCTFLW
jgi:hypothetical protein